MDYQLTFSAQAHKDSRKLEYSPLKETVHKLLSIVARNPFQNPPPYEKLSDEIPHLYSRRINIHHRLVYRVFEDEHIVRILHMWTHYE